MIETILKVLEIVGAAPKAAEAIKKIGLSVAGLRAAHVDFDKKSPLGRVIEGQRQELDRLIDDYYGVSNTGKYDSIELDKHRKRLAVKTCSLLRASAPISDQIPDYDKLIELFCKTLPAEL